MRRSLLLLAIWATPGLCSAGFCGTFFIDDDEHMWSSVAGTLAWLALAAVWLGVMSLWGPVRRISLWCFVSGAALSWFAISVGIAVTVSVARSSQWMLSFMVLWIAIVWILGVFPATIAAGRAWRDRRELDEPPMSEQ